MRFPAPLACSISANHPAMIAFDSVLSRHILLGLGLVFVAGLRADNSIQISVNPEAGQNPISPYIYGSNQDLPGVAAPGSRRMGGNRLTGYNWESNASNAGTDWYNSSDNFMVSGLPARQQSTPAIALTLFHDQSLAKGTPYTVLTLPMAGYVAADESGTVTASQAAPSSRWNAVVNNKPGGVYLSSPNLTDGVVYTDELLNLLLTRYGNASGPNGVKGYNLDNEPDLWSSTHPLLHPAQPTCAEIVSRSTALAQTVKQMDPSAEVLGPASYGSEGYFSFQAAPDWASIQSATPAYRWFLDYYLDQMSKASTTAGKRLLDVLDLHRYSDENIGGPSAGTSITNQTDFTDTTTDMERVQAPRVLWDPTYVENSWVQEWYPQFLPWVPNIQASIAKYYPGTKLSFTEYCYGGESDISGGIAQADVLGIYGKYGVHLGCLWLLHGTPPPLYVSAAFNLYLNYDGNGGKFGATSVAETDSDTVNSSAYASVDAANALHLVVLNKSYTAAANLSFQIAGSTIYPSAQVCAFDANSSALTLRAPAVITNNRFSYTLPPLTAAHFILPAPSPNQAFLQQLFTDVLGRPIDPGALSSFGAALIGGESHAAVLGDLFGSPEYRLRQIEPAIRLYYAALARPPDYVGLQNWSSALQAGTLSLTGAADQFASSTEFLLDYGSLDNTGFVQQLYRNVLGREADPDGLANWVGQLNDGASRGTVLIGFSESPEFQTDIAGQVEIVRLYYLLLKRMPTTAELQNRLGFLQGYGQTDTLFAQGYSSGLADSDYVRLVFQGFLRRAADPGALSAFSSALTAGTVSHGGLVNTLLSSTESSLYVAPASRLYLAALLRIPDQPGLDNWVAYVRAVNSLQSAADAFAASQEFMNRYGAMNNSDYVSALYVNVLGRQADPAGLADWVAQLNGGASRGQVLIGFSESPEGIALFASTIRTFLHYFTFLNATPAQSDLDTWKHYLATLDDQLRTDLLADPGFANGG
jgi:hypothetical protein